ncbi:MULTISPECIES: methyltransferase domain-containing protein [Nostoc]|uniref:Methyltransferase domain-containing protein n=1 Tax=Nostoc paludosum FACHB-159 TaxID=2692908 RepID=A0ABR8KBC1_9NOSO|nr:MULTISPECIES: methyltransferase domain-containing protein [Nostoc]MBD2679137.1 methyltransferase domain-containing protein [Nostoc sp. FACHB-857]MBD2735518.1 methyltransferase domain-containing protein [Nostoc paludosum FACHB-159]
MNITFYKSLIPVYLRLKYANIKSKFFPLNLSAVETEKINLHLGCGFVIHPKFVNVDLLAAPHIHYQISIDKLSPFEDNSVNLIYASHCLEHFPHTKVPKVLSEWFRVLKKGGILRLSVPDFDLLLNIYKKNGNNIDTILAILMGGQDYEHNFHMTTFTNSSAEKLLKRVGFKEIRQWQPNSCEMTTFNDYSVYQHFVAGKFYPVSLNIEAVK